MTNSGGAIRRRVIEANAERVVSHDHIDMYCTTCRKVQHHERRHYGDGRRVTTCPDCLTERGFGGPEANR